MIPTGEEMRRALEARHGVQLQARFDGGRVAICGLGGLAPIWPLPWAGGGWDRSI